MLRPPPRSTRTDTLFPTRRSSDLLLGEDYPAFDLLHWNGDVTNLPARWHTSYLRDLYRDNLLVKPGGLSACGVPIDLGLIETPAYVQIGRAHVCTPVTNAHLVCRLLLEKKKHKK